ncbi:MAG: helix-turn-helix transcriptional regulator [Alphaproteobacteria bacterium]|nr:helix-turn-helix transcriptional regulator [Alphaproteobacteria bacterium]
MHWRGAESDIIERIYEAATEPGLWGPLLEHISDRFQGGAAYLTLQDQATGEGRWLTVRTDPAERPAYFGYFATRNPLLEIKDFPLALRVLTDEDKLPTSELLRTEYYNDFMRRFGFHSILMWRLAFERKNTVVFNVTRPAKRDKFGGSDVEFAKALHPHLIRAYRLSTKLSGMTALRTSLEDALDSSAHALFIVDAKATVRHTNRCAEALLAKNSGIALRGGVLCAASHAATLKLHAMISAAATGDSDRRSGGDMSLFRACGTPLPVTVVPARCEQGPWPLLQPSALVCITDPEASLDITDRRLRDLFGLSRAEARVAVLLLDGRSTKEAARALGVSFHTVRGHLVRIFEKAGVNRQAELVRLMMRVLGQP